VDAIVFSRRVRLISDSKNPITFALTGIYGISTIAQMKRFFSILCLFALSAALNAPAQDAPKPTVDGYITAITSQTAFDVNGLPVVTTPQTEFIRRVVTKEGQTDTTNPEFAGKFRLGDSVQIFGSKDSTGSISAMKFILIIQNTVEQVHGKAVIQGVQQNSTETILEADGYRISITPNTVNQHGKHLRSETSISPGMWVKYSGKLDIHGEIHADRAKISEFSLTSLDKRLQQLGATASPSLHQAMLACGVKAMQYLVSSDAKTTEGRVQKIGMRLIPVFQKNLAAGNPQKINFQFCLLDDDYLFIPIAFQDGHIALSKHVVNLLQNDDQVAAVLADGMAQILEWRMPYFNEIRLSAGKEMFHTMFTVPSIIDALEPSSFDATTHSKDLTINWNIPPSAVGEQKERVALSLMQDAGYDIHQAPIAWQRIGSQYPKKSNTPFMPQKSIYQVGVIAREYSDTSNKQIATKASAPVNP